MNELVEVTTYSARLRHLAPASWLSRREPGEVGSIGRGTGVCNGAGYNEIYDQAALDAVKAKYVPDYQQVLISSLPLCKRCEKKSSGEAPAGRSA